MTMACHCRDCQKLTASDYSLTAMFPADAVVCEGDVVRGGMGQGPRSHMYCAACLGFIYSRVDWAKDRINLRSTLLDAAKDFAPFIEVMTRDRLPWVRLEVPHSFETAPDSPDEMARLMEAFAAS